MKQLLTLLLCLLVTPIFTTSVSAAEYQTIQGDVVTVSTTSDEALRLWCFGKQWPAKQQADGSWRGWIGIDLKTKPGNYPLEWSNRQHVTERVSRNIADGVFPISRI